MVIALSMLEVVWEYPLSECCAGTSILPKAPKDYKYQQFLESDEKSPNEDGHQ